MPAVNLAVRADFFFFLEAVLCIFVLEVFVMARAFVVRGMELRSTERFHKLNNTYRIDVLNNVFVIMYLVTLILCGHDYMASHVNNPDLYVVSFIWAY